MVQILGDNFEGHKLLSRVLRGFYGIGNQVAAKMMARMYIHPTARLNSLNHRKIIEITGILSNMKIENELRRELRSNIAALREMGSYRGRRHAMGMPVRGQRTRTQTSTAKQLNKLERRG